MQTFTQLLLHETLTKHFFNETFTYNDLAVK